MSEHVTRVPWGPASQHPSYGAETTYQMAAAWLAACADVADWGGSTGHLRTYLPSTVRYHIVDGTDQPGPAGVPRVLADLARYREPADGIAVRHVLELNDDWPGVITNLLAATRRRAVVITYTPAVDASRRERLKRGWPVWHFAPAELRALFGRWLVSDVDVPTTHPERVYFLARPPDEIPCGS